jgi:hypothetical protein
MDDAADNAAIVRLLDTPHICRQVRFDPQPLLIIEPKQIPAQLPIPKNESRRIESGLSCFRSRIIEFWP